MNPTQRGRPSLYDRALTSSFSFFCAFSITGAATLCLLPVRPSYRRISMRPRWERARPLIATCVVPSGVHGGYGGFFFDKNRSEKRCSLPIRGPMCGASALCSVASVVVAAGGATCGHRTLHHSVVSAHSWPQGGKGMPLLMK